MNVIAYSCCPEILTVAFVARWTTPPLALPALQQIKLIAFEDLKGALTHASLLIHSGASKEFEVRPDASYLAIGAVLVQKDERGAYHPVAYGSRVLNKLELQLFYSRYYALMVALTAHVARVPAMLVINSTTMFRKERLS